MELSYGLLFVLCAAAALAWFWKSSLAAREEANRVAMEACERLGLQFLDGTVAFARMALVRGAGGWIQLRRTYIFDYTANSIERRQGFAVLTGSLVETVGFAPEPSQVPDKVDLEPQRPPQHPESRSDNVLDLEEWRTRRKRG